MRRQAFESRTFGFILAATVITLWVGCDGESVEPPEPTNDHDFTVLDDVSLVRRFRCSPPTTTGEEPPLMEEVLTVSSPRVHFWDARVAGAEGAAGGSCVKAPSEVARAMQSLPTCVRSLWFEHAPYSHAG